MVALGWYLDVLGSVSHVLVRVFGEFLRKTTKRSKEGKPGKSGLHRSEGHLCRGKVLHRSEGCLAATRPKAKLATLRVHCNVAVLRRSEVLRHGEGTVHRGKKFRILF